VPFFHYLKVTGTNVPPLESTSNTESLSIPTVIPDSLSTVHNFAISEVPQPSRKRHGSPTIYSTTAAKIRTETSAPVSDDEPHTPDHPPPPSDPKFTGDLSEACGEDNPREMMKLFLQNIIISVFEENIAKVDWAQRYPRLQFDTDAYNLLHSILMGRSQNMKFKLKKQKIIAINNGAVILRYQNTLWSYRVDGNANARRLSTIVSVEVLPFLWHC
jgi:hypothetical protein